MESSNKIPQQKQRPKKYIENKCYTTIHIVTIEIKLKKSIFYIFSCTNIKIIVLDIIHFNEVIFSFGIVKISKIVNKN